MWRDRPRQAVIPAADRRGLLRAAGLLLGGALIGLTARPAAGTALVGSVERLRGQATAELDGIARPLQLRAGLSPGELLATGENARMSLRLGEAILRLGAETRLRIDPAFSETGGALDLIAGALQFERRAELSSDPIVVRTPFCLITAGDGRFYAGPSRGRFAVLAGLGRIEVRAAGRALVLAPQQGLDVTGPGQPASDPAAWQIARVREMQALLQ